jgi:farnesyl diphosphate synthase
MQNYAYDLGLAFQMTDDLLDAEGDEAEVGKKTRKDSDAGKATFVSLLGIDKARAQVRLIADQAASHLAGLGKNADPLRHLAQFVVERRA